VKGHLREISTRVAAVVVPVVIAGFLLPACSTIPSTFLARVPTSGPIKQGEEIGGFQDDQVIRVIARPPRPGMTQLQVVQGFIDASASFDGDHQVARQYLTAEASRAWDTSAGVHIYQSVLSLTDVGSTVRAVGPTAGEISPIGRMTLAEPGTNVSETFLLVRDDGEWRIRQAPPGLLLSQSDVDRSFRSYPIYFFNPSFESLVPDPRMIPLSAAGTATTLARALLSGPSDWLQPAVRTAFATGVKLRIDAVPVDGGVAHVDLTANALDADDKTRQAMSQQIVWTLGQLPGVFFVDVTAGGQPFVVPGIGNPTPRGSWPTWNPNLLPAQTYAYASRRSGVVSLVANSEVPVDGAAGTGDIRLTQIAVAADHQSLAGIDAKGAVWRSRLIPESALIRIRAEGTPTAIAYGPGSAVWITDGTVTAVAPDGTPQSVDVLGLPKRARLVKVLPSRDGTRAVVLFRRGGRVNMVLSRIVPAMGSAGAIQVDQPQLIETSLVDVADVAWANADSLAVLGSQTVGSVQVVLVDVATGSTIAQGAPDQATQIAAASGFPTLVASANGLVYQFVGGAWRERIRAASPAYPG